MHKLTSGQQLEKHLGHMGRTSIETNFPVSAGGARVTGNSLWGSLQVGAIVSLFLLFCSSVWTSEGRHQVYHSPLTWLSLYTQPWHSREIPPRPNPLILAQASFKGPQTCNTWQPNVLTEQPFPKGTKHRTSGGQLIMYRSPSQETTHNGWLQPAQTTSPSRPDKWPQPASKPFQSTSHTVWPVPLPPHHTPDCPQWLQLVLAVSWPERLHQG